MANTSASRKRGSNGQPETKARGQPTTDYVNCKRPRPRRKEVSSSFGRTLERSAGWPTSNERRRQRAGMSSPAEDVPAPV
ncbi:hypothetical protein K0M31_017509, partial [Melipona bicolor]